MEEILKKWSVDLNNREWDWRINMPCNFCNTEKKSGASVIYVMEDGKLTAKFICKDCWDEIKKKQN